MSDNDNFQECLDCPGCSCDGGQGCGCCPENQPSTEAEGSGEARVDLTISTPSGTEPSAECVQVDIDPMDLDQVAEKTEDLRPKVDPSRGKLDCFNYLADIPGGKADYDIVEVQFKNTRKGFYRNTSHLDLKLGDMVAVESQPGHDIGRVTLVGHLVRNQMKKAGLSEDSEIRKIFRFARESDMEKYYEAKALEIPTMIGSRQIAAELGLKMKIGDVEYQGDGLKAIFYYIADERVDFRQLIKILAERFKIRVEMRQIGARQEAGRIGGIGPCGRPLCCSTWMTNFVTVATSAARHQDLSLNPQKLAGQCAKLKCCLNFEIDTYLESVRKMPPKETRLETMEASWYHFKTDIFKGEITYSSDRKNAVNTVTITAERAFEIIEMNSRGEKPVSLIPDEEAKSKAQGTYNDILGDDSQIGRFDKKKKKKKKKKDKEAAEAANGAANNESADSLEEEAVEDNAANTESNPSAAPKAKEQGKEPSKAKQKTKDNVPVKAVEALEVVEEATQSGEMVPSEATSEVEPRAQSIDVAQEGNTDKVAPESLQVDQVQAPEVSLPESSKEPTSGPEFKEFKTEEEKHSQPVSEDSNENLTTESDNSDNSSSSSPSSPSVAELSDESSMKETESPSEEEEPQSSQPDGALSKEDVMESKASENTEDIAEENTEEKAENLSQQKHHHQGHHHHHPNHPGHEENGQAQEHEHGRETAEGAESGRKGNIPPKGQWQGKPGKGFKPQSGKGADQSKNREQGQGKGFKPQGGKGPDQQQNGQPQHGQPQHGQHGQPQHPGGQPPRGPQPGQQGHGKEPFKPKGQNPSQNRGNNPENQGKGPRPQRPGHPNQVQNGPRDEFQGQGGPNKKKKKKPYPNSDGQGNPNPQQSQGEQGRPNHPGHHNPNRGPQGPRQGQNPSQKNPNPNAGNGE